MLKVKVFPGVLLPQSCEFCQKWLLFCICGGTFTKVEVSL